MQDTQENGADRSGRSPKVQMECPHPRPCRGMGTAHHPAGPQAGFEPSKGACVCMRPDLCMPGLRACACPLAPPRGLGQFYLAAFRSVSRSFSC